MEPLPVAESKQEAAEREGEGSCHGSFSASRGEAAPRDEAIASFEAWWTQYPLKKAKVAALKAYQRVIKNGDASPDELLSGVIRYAAERDGQDPKYTKHPATWLNGACWADEPMSRLPFEKGQRRPTAVDGALSYANLSKKGDGQ
jgi:hypothetical protein